MSNRLTEIALEFGLCNCDIAYTSRKLTAPDCPFHAFAVQEAMEKYATECVKASLNKASSAVNMKYLDGRTKKNSEIKYFQNGADNLTVNKESITNPENIILL